MILECWLILKTLYPVWICLVATFVWWFVQDAKTSPVIVDEDALSRMESK